MEQLVQTAFQTSTATATMPLVGTWYSLFPAIAVMCVTILILLAALGAIITAFVKALKGGGSTQKVRQLESQEAEAFMDLQRGFQRMEERIDSLETLLMGRSQSANYDREREF